MPPQSEEQHAAISSNATAAIVAAVTDKRIRVLSLFLVAAAAETVRFDSDSGGDPLTGIMTLITGVPLYLPYNPLGHFQTVAGELLDMVHGGAIQLSGALTYVLID